MGTLLVPIVKISAIIIEAKVIGKANVNFVRAPVTSNLVVEGVDPDRRSATSAKDLRAQVLLIPINQIPDAIRILHPGANLLIWAGNAVCNVDTHPAKLPFAGLTFLFYCAHFILFLLLAAYHLIMASLWLGACGLTL